MLRDFSGTYVPHQIAPQNLGYVNIFYMFIL
jgi:hypothetical protein